MQVPAQRVVLDLVRAMCPGVLVSRVVAVDNPDLEGRFAYQHTMMVRLCASTNFKPAEYAKMASADKQIILGELNSWLRATKDSGLLACAPDDTIGLGWAFNGCACVFVLFECWVLIVLCVVAQVK